MKKKTIDKKRLSVVCGAWVLLLVVCICTFAFPGRLSGSRVKELRKEYPVCTDNPSIVSMRHLGFEEYMEMSDTLIYGEIVGGPFHSEKEITTGVPELDEKGGGSTSYDFFTYTVKVIEDSKHTLKEGDIIQMTANGIFEEYYPNFEPGMKIALGASRGDREEPVYHYLSDGTFYVTEDGYIMSAFPEENQKSRSGIHVRELLREFG